jgi:hypothetical protein
VNIEEARSALNKLSCYNLYFDDDKSVELLESFINEVESLLKNNSIKQTPALFKEKK